MQTLLKKHKNNILFWFQKNFNSKEIVDEIFLQELENKSLEIVNLNKLSRYLAEINDEKSYLFYYKKDLGSLDSSGQTYIWRTEGDGKTRPEHAAKEGQTFIWDEDENPGDAYGCRCRAEFVDENGNKTGLGRVKYDEDGNQFTQELKDRDRGINIVAENIEKLKQDMNSQAITDILAENRQLAEKMHLMGTPALVVAATPNGQFDPKVEPAFIPGAASLDVLQNLVKKASAS